MSLSFAELRFRLPEKIERLSMEYFRVEAKNGQDYNGEEFLEKLNKSNLFESYQFFQLCSPIYEFRDDFLDYISMYGLGSLFHYSMIMEDITSPSMTFNEIEKIILKFTSQLNGAKKVLITDPYLYAKNPNIVLFEKVLKSFEDDLQELILVTNKTKVAQRDIVTTINKINSKIKITEFETEDFHDRFWINVNDESGIVMGTSLNGLGKRIALIDKLSHADVLHILQEAKQIGVPNL